MISVSGDSKGLLIQRTQTLEELIQESWDLSGYQTFSVDLYINHMFCLNAFEGALKFLVTFKAIFFLNQRVVGK